MKETQIELVDRARPFDVKELFFSTTDRKGILTAWNEVFARVAGYEPSEMRGQPHNMVRHPHMPRCVFQLLWEFLLSDRPIGAYVKNLAKTGEYYWVFALASPHEGGFLSIRLKPTSDLLGVVNGLYGELLECERSFGKDWRAGMAASAKLLGERLKSLGFSRYEEFMGHALRTEFLARKESLAVENQGALAGQSLAPMVQGCGKLLDLRTRLNAVEKFLGTFVTQLNSVALNSGIRAVRLGDSGKALAVIGEEVARLSRSIGDQARQLRSHGEELAEILRGVSFNISLAALQLEMAETFMAERSSVTVDEKGQEEMYGKTLQQLEGELSRCATAATERALSSVEQLRRNLSHFGSFVDFLGKTLLTIQFSHVTGKTQAARVAGGAGFAMLLEDLIGLTESARNELGQLRDAVFTSRETVSQWGLAVAAPAASNSPTPQA